MQNGFIARNCGHFHVAILFDFKDHSFYDNNRTYLAIYAL